MNKLKWGNLKQNRCPKCGSDLSYDEQNASCKCGFKISLTRMNEIVQNRVANEIEKDYEQT